MPGDRVRGCLSVAPFRGFWYSRARVKQVIRGGNDPLAVATTHGQAEQPPAADERRSNNAPPVHGNAETAKRSRPNSRFETRNGVLTPFRVRAPFQVFRGLTDDHSFVSLFVGTATIDHNWARRSNDVSFGGKTRDASVTSPSNLGLSFFPYEPERKKDIRLDQPVRRCGESPVSAADPALFLEMARTSCPDRATCGSSPSSWPRANSTLLRSTRQPKRRVLCKRDRRAAAGATRRPGPEASEGGAAKRCTVALGRKCNMLGLEARSRSASGAQI